MESYKARKLALFKLDLPRFIIIFKRTAKSWISEDNSAHTWSKLEEGKNL